MLFAIFMLYLFVINIIAFFIMFYDKQCAKKGKRRISEMTLWRFAWYGGAIGCTLAMHLFRHKTQKGNFSIGFPLIAGLYCMGLFVCSLII